LFKEEKTSVFWVGLIVLGLASLVLLTEILSYRYYEAGTGVFFFIHLDSVSIIFGAIVFILIGFYMMKSGVKRDQLQTKS